VAAEKGRKAVISVNFSVDGKRTFNLRTNFAVEIPEPSFGHLLLKLLALSRAARSVIECGSSQNWQP